MSRATLSLKGNVTEDRLNERIDAQRARELQAKIPRAPKTSSERILMNGRPFVPANDARARALFKDGGGE